MSRLRALPARGPVLAIGLLVAGLLVTGCGVQPDPQPRALGSGAAPYRVLAGRPSPVPTGSARALVFLTQDGHLVAVSRRIQPPVTPATVLAALVAGPTANEQTSGLSTAVSDPLTTAGTSSDGVVTVALPDTDPGTAGRSDHVVEYAQIVATLCSLTDVNAVRFSRGGQALAVPRADGSLSSDPLTRQDYAALF